MRWALVLALLCLTCPGPALALNEKEIDPQQLLVDIDANLWSSTKHIHGRLIIDNGRRVRELVSETWMEGVTKSFSHYTAPPRERGTKMLKIQRKLWLYTPQTDRKILIAGHLLRQSMMGSDLSYEDMLEDEKVSEAYTAEVERIETYRGIPAVVLKLTARDPSKTYQSRRVWADPRRRIILKEQRFAKSGKLLKEVEFLDYEPMDSRLFPRRLIFRDMLKGDSQTTYVFDRIEFDVDIPRKYFSQSILKR